VIVPDEDDPEFATVLVDVTIAGRPYRLVLDTGAARTRLNVDEYTETLPPVGEHASSASFGGGSSEAVVTVADLAVGPLRVATLDVVRGAGAGQVLGMDVLGRCRWHVRLADGMVSLDPPDLALDERYVRGRRGHVYLDIRWPGASAVACWDTGAGATVVDRGFWLRHPDLFELVGMSVGTDANGDSAETPLLLMAGPVIGRHTFDRHKVVAVDLSAVNSTLDHPMDLILGYPTIRQADWLFDFPAGRWTLTRR
jgi:hypothetical protein